MKSIVPVEWACSFLGDKNYNSLQALYQKNPLFRFALISLALITQVIGLVFFCIVGLLIGSFVVNFLR